MLKYVVLTCASLFLLVGAVVRADYSVSPPIIEYTTEARDSFSETIRITNNSDRKIRIFPTVNEITLGDDSELLDFVPASMSDRSVSVTSWIEITRGRVELNPRETIKLPVTITVNPSAQPGNYYAFIGLAEASKSDDAEAIVMTRNAPGVIVRLAIPETDVEQLRLVRFSSERFVFDEAKRQIEFEVENVGDTVIVPSGEVIFYDARGIEIAAVPVGVAEAITPRQQAVFRIPIPEAVTLGRHKAFLSLDYGDRQRATIYDTTFFTVVPLQWLITLFVLLVAVTILLAWLYHRSRYIDGIHDGDEVVMVVRNGTVKESKDHDINLKQ